MSLFPSTSINKRDKIYMCVIIVKKAGMAMDSVTYETVQACWQANPHGAGFMYAREKKVHIFKGFMSLDALWGALAVAKVQASEPLAIHFRIATSGGVNKGMCHPFPLVPDTKKLRSTAVVCTAALAHNGVLGSGSETLSDTALAVRDMLHHNLFVDGVRKNNKKVIDFIDYYTEGSRLVWLFGCGSMNFFGQWNEKNGLLFSNMHWDRAPLFDGGWQCFYDCAKCGKKLEKSEVGPLCWTCLDAWEATGTDHCATCGKVLDSETDEDLPVCSSCLWSM